MKNLFLIFVLALNLNANEILELSASVTTLKQDKNTLYIGTNDGQISSLDLNLGVSSQNLKKVAEFGKIKNSYDESFSPQIYSIDVYKDSFLIISEADLGGKNLSTLKDGVLNTKRFEFDGLKKAYFIDENTYLFVFTGATITLVDSNLNVLKSFKFNHSLLNNSNINPQRNTLEVDFESGEIKLFDIKKWEVIANFDAVHKDNIYQVDYKNNVLVSCAIDGKLGVIKNNQQNFIQKNFFIYACALSPNGELIAYSDYNENTIEIVKSSNFEKIASFKNADDKLVIRNILFIDDSKFSISGYDNKIFFWSVK